MECLRPPDVLESEEYVGEEVNGARRYRHTSRLCMTRHFFIPTRRLIVIKNTPGSTYLSLSFGPLVGLDETLFLNGHLVFSSQNQLCHNVGEDFW